MVDHISSPPGSGGATSDEASTGGVLWNHCRISHLGSAGHIGVDGSPLLEIPVLTLQPEDALLFESAIDRLRAGPRYLVRVKQSGEPQLFAFQLNQFALNLQYAILCREYQRVCSPAFTSREYTFDLRQRVQQGLGCHRYEER